MVELIGTAKIIYEEVLDEIEEELQDAFEDLVKTKRLDEIITHIREDASSLIVDTINDNYQENMSPIKKLILGEKVARIVATVTKQSLQELILEITKQSFDVVEELRNEIIGEVFEETE